MDFYHVLEDNGGKKRKQEQETEKKVCFTENKIKDIMPTNKHRTELMLQEKNISYIHQFENYESKPK